MISRKRAARLIWLSHFDMERLVSRLLGHGMVLCVSLAVIGLLLQYVFGPHAPLASTLQASSIPSLLANDFRHRDAPGFWPDLLIDATVAILMLIPYLRLLTSALYLGLIERDRRLLMFISLTLFMLTIAVFTDLV